MSFSNCRFTSQMKKERFIAIKNQADSSTLELYFLDVIADNYDWWTGASSSKVQEIIDKVNAYNPSKILCIVDSEGGDAQVALSVYNFLKRCNARVETDIIGLACSAATVFPMASNKGKLRIARNAFMMIHKAQGVVYGTSDEIRKGADLVDMYTGQIVDIYSQRTGKTVDEINALMESGDFWMTGEEAVALGFADETFNDTPNLQVAARLSSTEYKNLPAKIRAQVQQSSEADEQKTFISQQFENMKNFFSGVMNAVRGVKPEEGKVITNQIADAMAPELEKVGDEIEATITNKVTETMAGETVNKAIALQVTNAVNQSVDFGKEGAAKTALDTAVKNAVDAAVAPFKEKVDALEKSKGELETEITNLKGKPTNSGGASEENTPKVVGKFS
jgi:ATP-dependent protease ClpP protease subunit